MKSFYCICIFALMTFLSSFAINYDKFVNEDIYDTVYISNRTEYRLVNDSSVKKFIFNDTIHSIDEPIPMFRIYPIRVLRIDTLQN